MRKKRSLIFKNGMIQYAYPRLPIKAIPTGKYFWRCLEDRRTFLVNEVPIWEKSNLTLKEAAAYSGIGICKLRKLSDRDDCPFVLWVGTKRLIKRKELDEFIKTSFSL